MQSFSLFHSARAFRNSALALASLLSLNLFVASGNAQSAEPVFSQIIVFGDSLSDTGNVRDRTRQKSSGTVDYPSHTFNYSDGRFTNSSTTDPSSTMFVGVWHEQLARTFLSLQESRFSLGGGTDYAFGGATTKDGTTDIVATTTPFGDVTITIDNMGRQIDNYLAARTVDPNALYVVWGGGNDLFNDDSATSVTATAARATALVSRLANAGAKFIMVPNVPPLGAIPRYSENAAKMKSLNAASASYRNELNSDLDASLSGLAANGVTPKVYRLDVWTNTIRLFANPAKYGFTDVRNSAQGRSAANPDRYLFWDDLHPTTAGHYQTAKGANDTLILPAPSPAKPVNLATRVSVGTGERVAIAGVIVTGNVPKKVLIRGLGPTLAASGVPTPLPDPTLTLFDDARNVVLANDNWKDTQQAEIAATGIAPKSDFESAILVSLAPGRTYTVSLADKNGTTGNGLVEVYDLEPSSSSALGNVSTRGFVGTGDNAMIGGFIVGQGDNPIVVVRAIGPTLAAAGVTNPLLDPTLELHDGNGTVIAFDDNWRDSQSQIPAVRATQLAPTDDRESAIVAFLPPGNYTAVVRGKADTTGVALVEAYRVP